MDGNPPLQGALLLGTQFELVSSLTVAGTLYGIAFVLYCLYLHTLFPQPPDHNRRRQALFMIVYSTIIMICGSYYLVANAWVIQDAYIRHGNFPGGPLLYENSTFHAQPAIAVGIVCQLAIDILTAVIQIWRLWVVWSATRYASVVVALPLLSLLGFTAIQIRVIILDITLADVSLIGSREIALLDTAGFALRGATTILPTILIAGFLTFQSRRQSELTGESQRSSLYMSVVAMLVESYALESTWTIVFTILISIGHPVRQFFGDTLTYIEIIAYLLILYRLELVTRRAYGTQGTHGPAVECRDNMCSALGNLTCAQSCVTEGTNTDVYPSENQDIL